jgi:hypothetical protein
MRAIPRVLGLTLAVLLAGCQQPASYFDVYPPSRAAIPTVPGNEVLLGSVALNAHPGDSVRLVAATPNGLGANVAVQVYALPLDESQGGVGAQDTRDMGRDRLFDDFARPFAGYEFTAANGPIQLVFGLTASSPGRIEYTSSTVRFVVNGGPELYQEFPLGGFACVDDPRPMSCSSE